MRRFYEDGAYWQGDNALGYDDYEGEVEHQAKTFARRVTYLERFATKGRLLEIGAGPGGLVRAALDRGWDAHGVDLCAPPGDSKADKDPLSFNRCEDSSDDDAMHVQMPHENDTEDIADSVTPDNFDHHHSKEWNQLVDKKAKEMDDLEQI